MTYEFGSDVLRCEVSDIGAELVSVKLNGKERLWQNDNGGWDGHAPILFPYSGRCAMVENGVQYPCPFHGFLFNLTFTLAEQTDNSITLTAHTNEETKKLYPHDVLFFVTYMVVGNCLEITYKAVNEGKETMYAAFGCHESYNLDGEVDEYEAVFEKDEKFLSWYAQADDGRLTGEYKDCGEGNTLALDADLVEQSVILANLNSRTVALKKRGEDKIVAKVTFPRFSNLLFWHPAGSRMVCVEPWQNLPDDFHAAPKEFSEKAGATAVQAGETLVACHQIEYF